VQRIRAPCTKAKEDAERLQFPIRVAFSDTVHGLQGTTLTKRHAVGCDWWESGMAYVALSRASCPSLLRVFFPHGEGRARVILDRAVRAFYSEMRLASPPAWAN